MTFRFVINECDRLPKIVNKSDVLIKNINYVLESGLIRVLI